MKEGTYTFFASRNDEGKQVRCVDAEAFERLLEASTKAGAYLHVQRFYGANKIAKELNDAIAPFQPDEYAGVVEAMATAIYESDNPGKWKAKAGKSGIFPSYYRVHARKALDAYLNYDGPKPMPRKESARG